MHDGKHRKSEELKAFNLLELWAIFFCFIKSFPFSTHWIQAGSEKALNYMYT